MSASMRLKEILEQSTMLATPELTAREKDNRVRCLACAHRCSILPGRSGVCRVRFNKDGDLRAPAGYVAGLQIDPIEKKPFYHAFPACDALSFGMLGCDLHCSYCQNWISSQVLRDDRAVARPTFVDPERLVAAAVEHKVPAMVSTYNEPLITADWAAQIFKLAKAEGITCGFVSNGNATPEVLEYIRPYVDLYKIDLKGFDDRKYRKLGAVLESVLETIKLAKQMGFWVEVVTLVVPEFNDSDDELKSIAGFIAEVSVDIPWHVTAFHPDYKMSDPPRTPASTLIRAHDIGKAAGLRHVYAGNLAGGVGNRESTYCPSCEKLLIKRRGFIVEENRMKSSACPFCEEPIAGVWQEDPPTCTGGMGIPLPVTIPESPCG
ncbi:MAG: AmmeMemoRadiSam system radical SAM enzyme [Phycisphaerales bacterium]|nr:MAG: AmmeMemoRadiSam system radical SAM enzyme [Phycisphaerales bacterium]